MEEQGLDLLFCRKHWEFMKLNADIQEAGERLWATGVRNKPFEADVAIPYRQKNNWDQILEEPRNSQSYSHWLARLSVGGTLKVFQTTSVDIKYEWTQSNAEECNPVPQWRQNIAFKTTKLNPSPAEFFMSSFQSGMCLFSTVTSHKIPNILKIFTKRFDKSNKLYTQIPKSLPKEIKDDQDWLKNIMSLDLSTQRCQEGNTTHADLQSQCVPLRATVGFWVKKIKL